MDFIDTMARMNADTELMTTDVVKIWMNWMFIIFAASIIFIWRHITARYVLASLVASMILSIGIYHFFENIHLLGIVHIIIWLPLLLYIWKVNFKNKEFTIKSPYGVWIVLLIATIVISLFFDVRDIILVIMGTK